jgi:hypothetical protein
MNISEEIKAKMPLIKKLLFGSAEKFVDAKLVDGTIIRIEPEAAVGGTVQVIGADGELMPAPDAQHQLEDGSVIATEGGLILEVIAAPEKHEDKPEDMEAAPAAPAPLNMDDIQKAVMGKVASQISERINNMKFANEADVVALKKENADLKNAVNELADLFEKFVSIPAEQPTKKVENYFKTDEKPSDNIDRWLQMRSKKKQSKNN